MNLLLLSAWQVAYGLVAIVLPAFFGFVLGVRWANARRTRWRQRALRLQAERDQQTAELAALTERLRRLRQPAVSPDPEPRTYSGLRVVRPAGTAAP